MRKFLLVLIISLSKILLAQQYTITYNYKSQHDSVIYKLNVDNGKSLFVIEKPKFELYISEIDSIQNQKCKNFMILKNNNDKPIVLDRVANVLVKTEIQEKLKWNLIKGNSKYLEYNTKKASTIYNDDLWEVEYTNDIPIMSGPFIFNNLPGLVVKAKNAENMTIELIGIEKSNNYVDCLKTKYKELSYQKYVELRNQKSQIDSNLLEQLINLDGINVKGQKINIGEDPIKILLK